MTWHPQLVVNNRPNCVGIHRPISSTISRFFSILSRSVRGNISSLFLSLSLSLSVCFSWKILSWILGTDFQSDGRFLRNCCGIGFWLKRPVFFMSDRCDQVNVSFDRVNYLKVWLRIYRLMDQTTSNDPTDSNSWQCIDEAWINAWTLLINSLECNCFVDLKCWCSITYMLHSLRNESC